MLLALLLIPASSSSVVGHLFPAAMGLRLGQDFPNLEGETTAGSLKLHDYWGDKWGILFSHPADFTPVCTTELGTVARYVDEFTKRNCKMIALSCNNTESHVEWVKDIVASQGVAELGFPIIADESREIVTELGMIGARSLALPRPSPPPPPPPLPGARANAASADVPLP